MKDKIFAQIAEIALSASIQSAIASYDLIGSGDAKKADHVAVEAMRNVLKNQDVFTGEVVIGEGERDEAPMLYIGELLGSGGVKMDIAVDPLEGTNLCANNSPNSITAIAIGEQSSLLHAPDVYMDKIATQNGAFGVVDLDKSVTQNIQDLAKFLNKDICEINIIILDRPRHEKIIQEARSVGAKVKLIQDGDLSAIILCGSGEFDLYIGSGGAPEGVLSAVALKIIGGYMQGRLILDTETKKNRANAMGILEEDKKYEISDLVKGDAVFAISGVTDGDLLDGVLIENGTAYVSSIILDSKNKTIREISSQISLV